MRRKASARSIVGFLAIAALCPNAVAQQADGGTVPRAFAGGHPFMDDPFDRPFEPAPPPNAAYRWGGSENVGMPESVPTCWENPDPDHDVYRTIVENAVAATWEAGSGIDFVGWGPCAAASRGLRIVVEDLPGPDGGPRTLAVGSALDGLPNGMRLNFTFVHWNPDCADDEGSRRACIYATAVEEFGRAAGIEETGACMMAPVLPEEDDSTPEYCVPPGYVFGGPGLSAYEAFASAYLYGPPLD